MQGWGFRYVSNIVWAKRRKDGGPDGRGVGFYFRNVTELILFGVRGKNARTLAPGRRHLGAGQRRAATAGAGATRAPAGASAAIVDSQSAKTTEIGASGASTPAS